MEIRIVDKEKFSNFIIVLISIILVITMTVLFINALKEHHEIDHTVTHTVAQGETYIVQQGDTIWGISARVMKERNIECDIREIVYQIRKDNNIKNCGDLQIGQELYIRGVFKWKKYGKI